MPSNFQDNSDVEWKFVSLGALMPSNFQDNSDVEWKFVSLGALMPSNFQDNSDVEWKFARASLVQEFKEAHPIIPPLNLVTVFFTFVVKVIIFSCGSERAKRAIEVSYLLLCNILRML